MGRISLELVPRSEASFASELETVKQAFPRVNALNIPDILKFDVRIPEACSVACRYFDDVIPHIRAVSAGRNEQSPYEHIFADTGIKEVLVILGDNPEIVSKNIDPCDTITLIKKFKKIHPEIKVYSGIDQWRSNFSEEMDYAKRKIDAGSDGFFTQPFFDVAMIEKWAAALEGSEVFWGVAPVVRESSRHYWETKNKVVFPSGFECTMEWNRDLARKVLDFSENTGTNVYFCPITVDFVEYLTGIL